MRPIAVGGCGTTCSGGCDRTICPRRNRHAVCPSAPDKLRSTMISVNKVFFEQVFMNITRAWGRYGLAVSALILLGVPAVAAPSAIKITQGVSQQSGGNRAAAAERAFTEADRLYQQGTAQSLGKAIAKWEEALKLYREAGDRPEEALTLRKLSRSIIMLLSKAIDATSLKPSLTLKPPSKSSKTSAHTQ